MKEKIIDKSILLSWIQLSKRLGINSDKIVSRLHLETNETYVPFDDFALLVEWLVKQTKNSNLGLLLGKQSNIAALGVVGQVIKSSNTIGEGLEKARQFFNLFSNVLSLKIDYNGNIAKLIFEIDASVYKQYGVACQQLILTSMMFSLNEIYYLTLQEFKPLSLNLSFDPINKEEVEHFFQCQWEANTCGNILCFDRKILQQPIVYSDYELMLVLEKLACERLKKQNEALNSLSNIVQALIYTLMDPYLPTLKTISAHLNMSERSLQRKLNAEKTSYTLLVTDIKKKLAQDFLAKKLSVKETSYMLGYSEPSAFIKAFQGWFGQTPQKFKNEVANNK
jgi:AraC-like DNA-binding protein